MRKWFVVLKETRNEQLRSALRVTHLQGEVSPRLSMAHLSAVNTAGVWHSQDLCGLRSHFSPRCRSFFAAAEIPRVRRDEAETIPLPLLFLMLLQSGICHMPFLSRKGFVCVEKLHHFP